MFFKCQQNDITSFDITSAYSNRPICSLYREFPVWLYTDFGIFLIWAQHNQNILFFFKSFNQKSKEGLLEEKLILI
jgi:hypothetical protein